MNASEGIGLVIIRFAFLPLVMEPRVSLTPIAYAELIVHALKDCSGVSLMRMHPNAMTNLMFPLGLEPGL